MTQKLNEYFNEQAAMEAVLTACRQEIKDRICENAPTRIFPGMIVEGEKRGIKFAQLPEEYKDMDELDSYLEKWIRGKFEFDTYHLRVNTIALSQISKQTQTASLSINRPGSEASYHLKISASMTSDLPRTFSRLGHYATSAPEGEPDILHLNANNGNLSTSNFNALKDALNEKVLSADNQITYELPTSAP